MPRAIPKGFEGAPAYRWVRMYKGKRYRVTCAELALPKEQWTEQGSYQAFAAWWVKKTAEIDAAPPVLPPEVTEVIETLKRKRAVLQTAGLDAKDYDDALQTAEAGARAGDLDLVVIDPRTKARADFLATLGVDLSRLDAVALEAALGSQDYWAEKFAAAAARDVDRTLGAVLDRWYALVHHQAKPSSVINFQGYVKEFKALTLGRKTVLGQAMPVECITEAKLLEVFEAIKASPGAGATKRKKFSTFKSFVSFCIENRLIPPLSNLKSKLLVFAVDAVEKAPPDPAKIKAFLDTLPDRLKLYALLALNTGSNNIDIGRLRHRQIDLEKRTLVKRRQKTGEWEKVPKITYWLWDETARLLRQERNPDAEFVLTDARGECLYISTKSEDGAKHYDKIKSQWRDHFGRSEAKLYTLRDFRFFSADLIKESEWRGMWEIFLGHSLRTVAERHYGSNENCTKVCQYLETVICPPAS